jgi:hypothetical protein
MAALWMPMNPLPSSRTKESRSAFCAASMSSSPSVKNATASKASRFLAPHFSRFLVMAVQSVRKYVSHRPELRPRL